LKNEGVPAAEIHTINTEIIYQPSSNNSNLYLYIIIAGMITSSTITIAVVKIYKCMSKKRKMNKAKITDIDLEDPTKRVDKEKFFKTMLPNEQLEIADSREILKVPTHHSNLTQAELLKEILTHR
jgi:hypothetical protein